jgi:hypothetical protein
VTQFVVLTLGTQLRGGDPGDSPRELEEVLCWEVPVILTIPPRGEVGRVGEILVDAYSGELRLERDTLREITTNAERLFEG